jgi:hypothetical protein
MTNSTHKKIREMIANNPSTLAKEIAAATGTSLQYVYSVRSKFFKDYLEKNKAAISRSIYPADPIYADSILNLSPKVLEVVMKKIGANPVVQPFSKPPEVTKFMGVTIAKDDVTNITDEQFERLRLNLTKPRQRMQSSQTEMVEPQADPVNHPPHYKAGGIETIDFIEAKKLNYNLGNVVKYLTRADLKGNRKQDLEKALWYLNRELNA